MALLNIHILLRCRSLLQMLLFSRLVPLYVAYATKTFWYIWYVRNVYYCVYHRTIPSFEKAHPCLGYQSKELPSGWKFSEWPASKMYPYAFISPIYDNLLHPTNDFARGNQSLRHSCQFVYASLYIFARRVKEKEIACLILYTISHLWRLAEHYALSRSYK